MRRWLLLAALAAAPALAQSDWLAPFRGRETFLVEDTAWLARDSALPPEAPPAFRARHLLLWVKTETLPPFWWDRRNVLLVEFPDGTRWVFETGSVAPATEREPDLVPYLRLATAHGAVEIWMSGSERDGDDAHGRDPREQPCGSGRNVVRGGGLEFTHYFEIGSRSVRTGLADVRKAAFSPEEQAQLNVMRRVAAARVRPLPDRDPDVETLMAMGDDPLAMQVAWGTIALDVKVPSEARTLALVPDPLPPGDLAPWRLVTEIPLVLRPMAPPHYVEGFN